MDVEFDPEKSAKNERERGLPFELAADLEWESALTLLDDRQDFGERRILAFAPMNGRPYAVCYVVRGDVRRIISLRKANPREEISYEKATTDR